MDTNCPGCGKRLKNLKSWEKHVKSCKKLAKLERLSYDIPIVSLSDIVHLETKVMTDGKEWGIWNNSTKDWVRDKTGKIDSRAFERNIKTLLNIVIAESIIANATNK